MSTPETTNNNGGKLQELIEKWGSKSAMLLLCLCAWVYQQDRANSAADIKAVAARTAANERAIGRLQEGKASREEVKAMIETIKADNARGRDDFKESIRTLRDDLIQRMDLIDKKNRE